MMNAEQLDNWFSYHPPTEETAPKYAAIRAAEAFCLDGIQAGISAADVRYEIVNDACRAFAVIIDEQCPDGADKDSAIRCIRLARNAANEAIATNDSGRLLAMAKTEIQKARWLAGEAIKCGGI